MGEAKIYELPFDKFAIKTDKSVFLKLLPVLVVFCLTALCIYFLTIYMAYFSKHGFFVPVTITQRVKIDAIGALIPIIVGLISLDLEFVYFRFSVKVFLVYFIVSVFVAFGIFQYTSKGVVGSPVLFALIDSLLLIFLIFKVGIKFGGRKKLVICLLLNLSAVPFSLCVVDLYFLSRYSSAIIGGGGAIDSIILSTTWTALLTTLIILVWIIFENTGLLEKLLGRKKKKQIKSFS